MQRAAHEPTIVAAAAERWREIVTNLKRFSDYAKPDELEAARILLREYTDEVAVVEEPEGVFGYARLNNGAGYKSGAEERT